MSLQIGQQSGGLFGGSTLSLPGERAKGQDVRTQNVTAVMAVANVVRTSLGPQGLDKMLVDDIGDVTITNDGATILKQIEVEHPAAKVLVELSDLQDHEVGDGTTSVVIIAAELLKRATALVRDKIHSTNIISGYRLAMKEAVNYIKDHLSIEVEKAGEECLMNVCKTTLSSKLIGADSDFFAKMIVDAIVRIKRVTPKGKPKYNIKNIELLKSHGKSSRESVLIDGYALNCTKAGQQMPSMVKNAKIAILDFPLNKARMHLGVQILVDNPEELEKIRDREGDITKEKIDLILKSGANVVLTTKGIDDLCQKYLVEAGILGVRRCRKEDLKRIAKITGGQFVVTLANLEGEESFDPNFLGSAESVSQERIADDELIYIRGAQNQAACSIVLRGANEYMLDEMERSVHDALCAVKRTLESGFIVPGGGAVESALSIYLENFATTLGSREQLAIAEFAEALLVIPKTLCVNAAKDATDLTARLRAFHNTAQTDPEKKDLRWTGLDLLKGKTRNNIEAGVVEPAMNKIKCIQFATEAAITILRIDDLIKIASEEEARAMMEQQQQM